MGKAAPFFVQPSPSSGSGETNSGSADEASPKKTLPPGEDDAAALLAQKRAEAKKIGTGTASASPSATATKPGVKTANR
jgi:hypothetical protein